MYLYYWICIILFLEISIPTLIMPRRQQRAIQSDDEHTTPPTPSLQITKVMEELKHGLRIMRTTFKCFSLR